MNPWPLIRAEGRTALPFAITFVMVLALAIALGVAAAALERSVRRGSAAAAEDFDLVVGAPGSSADLVLASVYLRPAALPLLPGALLAKLPTDPGVAWAAPIGFGDNWRGRPIVGTTVDLVTLGGRRTLPEGRAFATRDEAVVGARVPLALGAVLKPQHGAGHGNPIMPRHHDHDDDDGDEDHAHGDAAYKVVGRLPPQNNPWDNAILVPIETVWGLHGLTDGHAADDGRVGPPFDGEAVAGVPAILIKPRAIADAYSLRARLRAEGQLALFPAELLVELHRLLGGVGTLVGAITLATQVLVFVSVLLAVVVALAARRRRLALLRALGASRGFIFLLVWGELLGLLGLAGLLGLGLGALLAWGLAQLAAASSGVGLPIAVGRPEILRVVVLVALGAALAVVPGWLGFRRPVAADLRG